MNIHKGGFGIIGLMILSSGFAVGRETAVSARKTALLEQEYAIAKTSATYFIFNFETKTVALKAKGLVLKEWPFAKARTWGRAPGVMTYPLVRKTALEEPQRPDISPGKEEPEKDKEKEKKPAAKSDDLGLMELSKMPVRYTLELPDDIRIKVRLQKKGFGRIVEGFARFFSKGIGRSFKTISRGLKKSPFTDIDLVFADENAARNIYWAFFENQKCILYWPE